MYGCGFKPKVSCKIDDIKNITGKHSSQQQTTKIKTQQKKQHKHNKQNLGKQMKNIKTQPRVSKNQIQLLQNIKNDEINFQKKKINNFDEDQAEILTSRIIQKITTQFVKHLKADDTEVSESIQVINKVFQH